MVGLLGKGLNKNTWAPLESELISNNIKYNSLTTHTDISKEYSLIFSLGYSRIIPQEYLDLPSNGIVVFHSSDLPKGRGWAPLFYTITEKEAFLTQTMFYADKDVDSGPIIAKARYPINDFLTISDLRKIDDNLTCMLFSKYLPLIYERKVNATPQDSSKATYWKRRRPTDSEIDPDKSIMQIYNKMRALPDDLPAFFEYKGVRVTMRLNIDYEFEFDHAKVIIQDFIRD